MATEAPSTQPLKSTFCWKRILRSALTAGGVLLLLLGLLVIRLPKIFLPLIKNHTFLNFLLFDRHDHPLIIHQPETLLAGLAVIALGITCLIFVLEKRKTSSSTSPKGEPITEESTKAPPKAEESLSNTAQQPTISSDYRWFEGLLMLVWALGMLGLFFWFESRKFMTVGAALIWLGLLIVPIVFFFYRDRKSAVQLKINLSWWEIAGLSVAFILLLTIYASGFNSWKYSFIGDEYAFYWAAEKIVNQGLWNLDWLEASGVYGDHPKALSGWQALWMAIFGSDNFAWRLSAAISTLLTLPAFYLILRHLLQRRSLDPRMGAAIGCAVFFLSEQIIAWARNGKQSSYGLPALIFAVCFCLAAKRRHSRLYFLLAGIVCGVGIHLNILGTAIASLILAGLLIAQLVTDIVQQRKLRISFFIPMTLVFAGFLAAASPNLVQRDYYEHHMKKHIHSHEDDGTFQSKIRKEVETLLQPLYFKAGDHFLYGSVVDPLTALLALLGLATIRQLGWRRWIVVIWILLVCSWMTGGMCQYQRPPMTRTLLVMFPVALLAGAGFQSLLGKRKWHAIVAGVCTILLMGGWNLIKHQQYNPYKLGVSYTSSLLKRIEEAPSEQKLVFLFPEESNPYFCRSFVKSYGYENRAFVLEENPQDIQRLENLLKEYGPSVHLNMKGQIRNTRLINQQVTLWGGSVEPDLQHQERYSWEKEQTGWTRPIIRWIDWMETH